MNFDPCKARRGLTGASGACEQLSQLENDVLLMVGEPREQLGPHRPFFCCQLSSPRPPPQATWPAAVWDSTRREDGWMYGWMYAIPRQGP